MQTNNEFSNEANIDKETILELKGITKRFGGLVALNNVDFKLYEGEVIALLGDNGAGKSTLIKIICGVYQPDGGEIFINNKKTRIENPAHARHLKIETVYQDLAMFDVLNVVENLFCQREITTLGIINNRMMNKRAIEILNKTGIKIKSLKQSLESLSGGQKHAVAIARTVYVSGEPTIIIMDEPTAGLGVKESNLLLDIIMNLKVQNKSVILITHHLEQAFSVADRIVVLRSGSKVGEKLSNETDSRELIEMMVG